jgi:hypothetical protein
MTGLWFHARKYGWGWTPATIEGWLVVAAFLIAVIINTVVFVHRTRTGTDIRSATITFLLWLAILTGILVTIGWMTGERPRWRWGN